MSEEHDHRNISVVTSFLNFESQRAVLFTLEWIDGAENTALMDDMERQTATLATFPSFHRTIKIGDNGSVNRSPPSILSWEGSFVQSVRRLSEGPRGGPTVFYNASDPSLETVIVASPFGNNNQNRTNNWNTFTAGNNKDWTGTLPAFSPGTSGRISRIPGGFQQSFLLYEGSQGGITSTLDEWGKAMQKSSGSNEKVRDVTLEKIGVQTDNGAFYCFCSASNCSDVLLKEKDYLDSIGIPIGYLSFQGAGTSSGRGTAAPWCVSRWSADDGQDRNHYPLHTKDFQRALGVPLQLYAPYFCPDSIYFHNTETPHPHFDSVSSNTLLPGCSGFNFETANSMNSYEFFSWFLKKGIDAGMTSFESDFMNQNVNCVDEFVQSTTATDEFLRGMASAAVDLNIPIQWCYATPNEVLASLDLPSVTNFRVSFDYCYGQSYDIGESSLLVWALGAAPSKDTLWTTINNKTETPGCKWTPDHESVAVELHVVLALLSSGPVGISDGIGWTNKTLVERIIAKDGTLLQPSKPITAVDSNFLIHPSPNGFLYGTYGVGNSWIFVSFQLEEPFSVTLRDFFPRVQMESDPVLAYRTFSTSMNCRPGRDAIKSGCVNMVAIGDPSQDETIFVAQRSTFESPGSDLAPNVVTVWQGCAKSGVFLLGELDKYVALSPKRFESVVCTQKGVMSVIRGTTGETIRLTFLIPQRNRYTGNTWYEVETKEIILTTSITSLSYVPQKRGNSTKSIK
jgi:hypothetical protein